MNFPGLNPRQCRALLALLEHPKPERVLVDVIGNYATNTIKALDELQLIAVDHDPRMGGELPFYKLTAAGYAVGRALHELEKISARAARPRATIDEAHVQ